MSETLHTQFQVTVYPPGDAGLLEQGTLLQTLLQGPQDPPQTGRAGGHLASGEKTLNLAVIVVTLVCLKCVQINL